MNPAPNEFSFPLLYYSVELLFCVNFSIINKENLTCTALSKDCSGHDDCKYPHLKGKRKCEVTIKCTISGYVVQRHWSYMTRIIILTMTYYSTLDRVFSSSIDSEQKYQPYIQTFWLTNIVRQLHRELYMDARKYQIYFDCIPS